MNIFQVRSVKLIYVILAAIIVPIFSCAQDMTLPISRSDVYVIKNMFSGFRADDNDIVETKLLEQNKLLIKGIKKGNTIVRIFGINGNEIDIVNISVTADVPGIKHNISNLFPDENIGIEGISDHMVLTGTVSHEDVVDKISDTAKNLVNDPNQKIINLLKTDSKKQVMLRVRVGEISKYGRMYIGSNFDIAKNNPLSNGSGIPGMKEGISSSLNQGLMKLAYQKTADFIFQIMLDAMEDKGVYRSLAEPNLVAMSGTSATFHAGGELAIPIAQPGNVNSIEYKPIGVGLKFTPHVLANNRIRLQVEPEVSELSSYISNKTGSGHNMPFIKKNTASTTVELAPGESFMIAGLVRDLVELNSSGVPGVKKLPIIGALLRKSTHVKEETELVISVTPYIANPAPHDQIIMPTENVYEITQSQFIFFGNMNSRAAEQRNQSIELEGDHGYLFD